MLLIQFLQLICRCRQTWNRLRISSRRVVQHCQFFPPRDHVRPVSGVLAPETAVNTAPYTLSHPPRRQSGRPPSSITLTCSVKSPCPPQMPEYGREKLYRSAELFTYSFKATLPVLYHKYLFHALWKPLSLPGQNAPYLLRSIIHETPPYD